MLVVSSELERIARVGYDESLRRIGVSPVHAHNWEVQTDEARLHWIGVTKAILDELIKVGREKTPDPDVTS